MNRVIYRDYIVNRRFFIYCCLATLEPVLAAAALERHRPIRLDTGHSAAVTDTGRCSVFFSHIFFLQAYALQDTYVGPIRGVSTD